MADEYPTNNAKEKKLSTYNGGANNSNLPTKNGASNSQDNWAPGMTGADAGINVLTPDNSAHVTLNDGKMTWTGPQGQTYTVPEEGTEGFDAEGNPIYKTGSGKYLSELDVLNNPIQNQKIRDMYDMEEKGSIWINSEMKDKFGEYMIQMQKEGKKPMTKSEWIDKYTENMMQYQSGDMSEGAFQGKRGNISSSDYRDSDSGTGIYSDDFRMFSEDPEGNLNTYDENTKTLYNSGLINKDQLDSYNETSTGITGMSRNLDRKVIDSDRSVWYDPNTGKYMTNWKLMGMGGKDREISKRRYEQILKKMQKRHGRKYNKALDDFDEKEERVFGEK